MTDESMNRRVFLERTGLGFMASGAAGLPLPDGDDPHDTRAEAPPKLIYRTLERTGLRIPLVS